MYDLRVILRRSDSFRAVMVMNEQPLVFRIVARPDICGIAISSYREDEVMLLSTLYASSEHCPVSGESKSTVQSKARQSEVSVLA